MRPAAGVAWLRSGPPAPLLLLYAFVKRFEPRARLRSRTDFEVWRSPADKIYHHARMIPKLMLLRLYISHPEKKTGVGTFWAISVY